MKDDAISRQGVLKLLSTIPPEEAMTKAMLIQSVKQMDAAQPERKRGKWIRQDNKGKPLYGWFFCSECGAFCGGETNFCSECGADMREDEQE